MPIDQRARLSQLIDQQTGRVKSNDNTALHDRQKALDRAHESADLVEKLAKEEHNIIKESKDTGKIKQLEKANKSYFSAMKSMFSSHGGRRRRRSMRSKTSKKQKRRTRKNRRHTRKY